MLSRRFVPRGLTCMLVAPLSEKILRLFSEYLNNDEKTQGGIHFRR